MGDDWFVFIRVTQIDEQKLQPCNSNTNPGINAEESLKPEKENKSTNPLCIRADPTLFDHHCIYIASHIHTYIHIYAD